MSFKITITETKEIETFTTRQWVKGGPDGKSQDGEYGYTPQIPEKGTKTTTVFEMVAESIDLPSVAAAVFGAPKRVGDL